MPFPSLLPEGQLKHIRLLGGAEKGLKYTQALPICYMLEIQVPGLRPAPVHMWPRLPNTIRLKFPISGMEILSPICGVRIGAFSHS